MIRSFRCKTLAAWLGIVALAMAALMPIEMARASAPETIVLCTGHGTVIVPADQSGGAPAGKATERAHCECCLHAPPAALAPHQETVALRRASAALLLPPAIDADGIERAFSPEQPRAPPAV
jgi:hypothetical protein